MYNRVEPWINLVEMEERVLGLWEEIQAFEKLRAKNKGKPKWSFLDGPITANNPMGVHHAWGRTLKDVYQRYFAMNGRELRYQNGFDCQGLWVEVEVEKELGFASKKDIEKFGIDNFVNKCKDRANKYSKIITEQSKRLGFWMDWDNSYYTMSDENNYTIWKFLKKAYDRDFIYKGHDVIPWCPRCGTGISQHEMQEGYKETSHLSFFLAFPVVGRPKEALLVWTTTPWTLSSNVAVAVNPEGIYIKAKKEDFTYYIIKSRAEKILGDKNTWEVVEELKGSKLIGLGLKYVGPFDELPAQKEAREHHKIIEWDEVTEEEGTGIVHIAPGCGVEDHQLGKKYNLPIIAPLNEDGTFTDGFGYLTGKHASDVTKEVKQDLTNKNVLFLSEQYIHSYPHCWRCNKQLLFRFVDEWFIKMDPWRDEIKKVAKKITWIPSFGLDLELDWLTNMRDWMISKKRYWGLALPIWECKDCNYFTVIGSYEELKKKATEGWNSFEGNSPHRPWIDSVKIKCPKCKKNISRVADVGNPWLDAGIVPYSTVNYNSDHKYWKKWIPADLVLECFPGQFRNWFYSLLAMSTLMEGVEPFKTLVGHALVRDEKGEEMHKSKGNAIWFDDAAKEIGVEIMRWLYCSHEISTNLNFGYGPAKLVRGKFFNTFWNSYAFFINYARLIDYKWTDKKINFKDRPDFDRWIISKLNLLVETCHKGFQNYDTRAITREIENFTEILSNWYIRNNRRRFWASKINDDTVSALQTLRHVLITLIKISAPILPFITEEMYQNIVLSENQSQPKSVHLTDFPAVETKHIDKELVEDMDNIIRINSIALSAREKAKIKIKQPLSKLIVSPNNDTETKAVKRFENLLKSELNVKNIEVVGVKTKCPIEIKIWPSKKSLGQKYKEKARFIIEVIEKEAERLAADFVKTGDKFEFKISVDGQDYVVNKEDILVEENDIEGLAVVRLDEGWIAFDTRLTEDLIIEGMMRDFLRKMQVLRKEVGLEIEDRIQILYKTDSDKLTKMVSQYKDFICEELLCTDMQEKADPSGSKIKIADGEIEVKINKK